MFGFSFRLAYMHKMPGYCHMAYKMLSVVLLL